MFAYPGIGRQLYLSTYSGPTSTSQVTYPLNAVIANAALSDSEPLSDAMQTTVQVNYNVVPTDTTYFELSPDPTFTNVTQAITIPASATDKVGFLTITEPINGFGRVRNHSGVQINSVFINKQVSTIF